MQEQLTGLQKLHDLTVDGQKSMRTTISRLEDQIAETLSESLEYAYCVGLSIDCDYDENVRDSSRRVAMESQLRDELCIALRVPKTAISVLCYCRGAGITAEVKLSSVVPASASSNLSGMQ